jgi:uncharacterized membrane protein
MNAPRSSLPPLDDTRLERILGNLLRAGVIVAALVVAAGGVFYLAHHARQSPDYTVFHGEPAELRSVPGIVAAATTGQPSAVIQFGLLLLIGTPILRVACSVVGFALERDWMYVVITCVVLGLLLFSLIGKH